MSTSDLSRILLIPVGLLAAAGMLAGLGALVDMAATATVDPGYTVWGLASITAGVLMSAGVFVRTPRLSAALLAVGAVVMAANYYWAWPIGVPLATGAVAIAAFRARELTRERRHSPASPAR